MHLFNLIYIDLDSLDGVVLRILSPISSSFISVVAAGAFVPKMFSQENGILRQAQSGLMTFLVLTSVELYKIKKYLLHLEYI